MNPIPNADLNDRFAVPVTIRHTAQSIRARWAEEEKQRLEAQAARRDAATTATVKQIREAFINAFNLWAEDADDVKFVIDRALPRVEGADLTRAVEVAQELLASDFQPNGFTVTLEHSEWGEDEDQYADSGDRFLLRVTMVDSL